MKVSGLLRSLNVSATATETLGLINDNFDAIRKILQKKLSLSDNLSCDVISGVFDSGQPTPLQLSALTNARGAIVLGSSVPCIGAPHVATVGRQAHTTLYFARGARQVRATVVLFEEGTAQYDPGTLIASTVSPGLVYPDGTSITMDSTGKLSAIGGGENITADTHPTFPTMYDDEFEGTAVDLTGARRAGAQAWTWYYQTPSANASLSKGSLVMVPDPALGTNVRMLDQPMFGKVGTWACKMSTTASTNYDFFGLYLRSGTSFCGVRLQNYVNGPPAANNAIGSLGAYILASSWNSPTSNNNPVITVSSTTHASSKSYLALQWDGSHIFFMWSPDGIIYFPLINFAYASVLTGTPTNVGLLGDCSGYTTHYGSAGAWDWFRKIA